MKFQSEREYRIRRNAKLIVAIMSVVAAIFVIGVAITNPEFLAMALVAGLIVVVLPVITYLYFARWMVIVGSWMVNIGTWLDKWWEKEKERGLRRTVNSFRLNRVGDHLAFPLVFP